MIKWFTNKLLLAVILFSAVSYGQFANPNVADFTRILDGSFANDKFSTYGVAWCDYNNDGLEDIFAVNNGAPCRLYKNLGNGTFEYDSLAGFQNLSTTCMASTWGDYDNDGFQDVFITTSVSGVSHVNYLFKNNGNSTFTQVTNSIVTQGYGWSLGAAWDDYDNDGYLDLYVANWDTVNYLYHNNGDGSFSKIVSGDIVNDNDASYAATWVDYDNDGLQDMFVANYYTTTYPPNQNRLYKNNGNGTFTKILSGELVTDTTLSTGSSWGDYDNDGDLDVFIPTSYFHGDYNMLWRNNGDGTFTKLPTAVPSLDQNTCYGSAWADFNNDGNLDLYVSANRSSYRTNFLYENNGDGTFTKITTSAINLSSENSFGGAWGDYNNNGAPDLYVATGSATKWNQFFRNNDTTNNWIKFRLVSSTSNKSAIGTRVVLYAANKKQTRLLQGNTGQYSQGSLYPVFGLGASTVVDSVFIYWPSGIVDKYKNLAARQIKTVLENETVVPVELTSFTAAQQSDNIIIRWSTATEKNNKSFEVYKKKDSGSWNLIATVNGNGTTSEPRNYSITDEKVVNGKYTYKLKQIDFDGTYEEKEIKVEVNNINYSYNLDQNYPNPFNPTTNITFSIPKESRVTLKLYNVLGKEVKTLLDEVKGAGNHNINVKLSDLNSGVYFYTITSGNFTATKKLTLMK
ncbi:MAG TPA: FG-GAP-like repeat-containing protein [Ignavibacteriaceae bacterium]|nr:FG-GAP-like repeat-containing protein [Ignavibacteriaceae bacterium]